MSNELIGKGQALKELVESGGLPDDYTAYVQEWPVIDMSDLEIPEQSEPKS